MFGPKKFRTLKPMHVFPTIFIYRPSMAPLSSIAAKGLSDLANSIDADRRKGMASSAASPAPAAAIKKKGSRGGKWNQSTRAEKDIQQRAQQMGELRAYFEELDDFSLVEESPGMRSPLVPATVPGPGPLPVHAPAPSNHDDSMAMSTGGKPEPTAFAASPSPMGMRDTPAAIPEDAAEGASPSTSPSEPSSASPADDGTDPVGSQLEGALQGTARRSSCFLGLSRRSSVLIHPTPGKERPHRPSSLRTSLVPPPPGPRLSMAPPPPPVFNPAAARLSLVPSGRPSILAPPPTDAPAAAAAVGRTLGRLSLAPPGPGAPGTSFGPAPRFSLAPAPPMFHETAAPRVSMGPRPSLAPPPPLFSAPSNELPATPFSVPTGPGPRPSLAPAVACAPPNVSLSASPTPSVGAVIAPASPSEACDREVGESEPEPAVELEPLQQLAVACSQSPDLQLLPTMDELLGSVIRVDRARKIGEGTFGEAFKEGSRVVKIVPVEGAILVNGEKQKTAQEVLAEVVVTRRLSSLRQGRGGDDASTSGAGAGAGGSDNTTGGFVEAYRVGICRGRYSAALQDEWHRWARENASENDPVDVFPADQCYCVFVLSDGGIDLEHFEFRSFEEARSMLVQTAFALAVAEEACAFEHRDLHWGNVLLRRTPLQTASCTLRGVEVEFPTEGIEVTVIDFTLSRLVTEDGTVAFCDLEADPELFKGPRGNCQADTYRRMRKALGGKWATHNPETNCMWMHYLTDCLLNEKGQLSLAPSDRHALKGFRKRALGYSCTADLLFDEFFQNCWVSKQ